MLGFPLLYFKGMRLMMFQLSGFYPNRAPLTVSLPDFPCKLPRSSWRWSQSFRGISDLLADTHGPIRVTVRAPIRVDRGF